jgi:hypothetical protein
MGDHDLGVVLLLVAILGDLSVLEAGAGDGEGGKRIGVLEDLALQLETLTEPIDEGARQIVVRDGAANRGQVIGEALQLTGIIGDGEVAAWTAVESFAEVEVP